MVVSGCCDMISEYGFDDGFKRETVVQIFFDAGLTCLSSKDLFFVIFTMQPDTSDMSHFFSETALLIAFTTWSEKYVDKN